MTRWRKESCCQQFSFLHSPIHEDTELRQPQSPNRSAAPFSILHSPVLLIKLIMLRVLYHFNVSPQQSVHQ